MQGEYVRQIAVCGGSLCSGHKLMRDLVIDVYMSPSVLYFMCGKLSHLPARSGT